MNCGSISNLFEYVKKSEAANLNKTQLNLD